MLIINGLFIKRIFIFIWASPRASLRFTRGRVLRGFSACHFVAAHRFSLRPRAPTPAYACAGFARAYFVSLRSRISYLGNV